MSGINRLFVQGGNNFWAYQAYVPEPASVVLWSRGLVGLLAYRLGTEFRFRRI